MIAQVHNLKSLDCLKNDIGEHIFWLLHKRTWQIDDSINQIRLYNDKK